MRLAEKHPEVNKPNESHLPKTNIAEDQNMPKTSICFKLGTLTGVDKKIKSYIWTYAHS